MLRMTPGARGDNDQETLLTHSDRAQQAILPFATQQQENGGA
jgi:hypothetical protein